MTIKSTCTKFNPQRDSREPLPVIRYTFESRNATFRVESSQRDWDDYAISLFCGPLGLNINPDEAEAIGQALISCANHYRSAKGGVL